MLSIILYILGLAYLAIAVWVFILSYNTDNGILKSIGYGLAWPVLLIILSTVHWG